MATTVSWGTSPKNPDTRESSTKYVDREGDCLDMFESHSGCHMSGGVIRLAAGAWRDGRRGRTGGPAALKADTSDGKNPFFLSDGSPCLQCHVHAHT